MTTEPGPGGSRAAGQVSLSLDLDVTDPATVVLQVGVALHPLRVDEQLLVTGGGRSLEVETLAGPVGGRQHVIHAPVGRLEVRYRAILPTSVQDRPQPLVATTLERIEALRPSRYCPSDRVLGLAAAQFGGTIDDAETMMAICDYVSGRTSYLAGASGPTTDAVETLLSGQGVCRDYAHTVAMLARAAGIPARVVAVYAPGLSPMDMHAVVEAAVDGRWRVWDATRLAPRQSLVRIATGRDAADTAFVTVLDGHADLLGLQVWAVAAGELPVDDHQGLVSLET